MNLEKKVGRRRTLQLIGMGSLTAVGLVGCGGGEESGGGGGGGGAAADGTGCNTPVPAEAQSLRTTLNYVEQSAVAGSNCSNCAQYKEAQYGECGGCNLFAGPVQPNGHCVSWAAKAG